MLNVTTAVTACCDRPNCLDVFRAGGEVALFADEAVALVALAEAGWRFDVAGLICPGCVRRATCARVGHLYVSSGRCDRCDQFDERSEPVREVA